MIKRIHIARVECIRPDLYRGEFRRREVYEAVVFPDGSMEINGQRRPFKVDGNHFRILEIRETAEFSPSSKKDTAVMVPVTTGRDIRDYLRENGIKI